MPLADAMTNNNPPSSQLASIEYGHLSYAATTEWQQLLLVFATKQGLLLKSTVQHLIHPREAQMPLLCISSTLPSSATTEVLVLSEHHIVNTTMIYCSSH